MESEIQAFSKKGFPDFLIIGPHRSGTTWLHQNIKKHPEILFPVQKEVHYFCEHHHLRPVTLANLPTLDQYIDLFEQSHQQFLLNSIKMLMRHGKLYNPLKGEGTACYSVLDRTVIQEIVQINPKLKVILMIRNPIDRAWSHTKHIYIKQRGINLSEVSSKELETFFKEKHIFRAGEYTKTIDLWNEFLKPGNLFYGEFKDITEKPKDLIMRVYKFLGVTSDSRYISKNASQKINATPTLNIPDKYKTMLSELFFDELVQLKQRFGISFPS